MIVQIGCGITWMIAERANVRFQRTVYCYVVLECLSLVRLVFTVGAVELEYPCMSVLTVKHLVKPHVSIATLVTPVE